ncbi:LOW QUALITY PROTEIN: mitochondrial glutathione transporter SLC25A40 [Phaenicophaeus curvirostris]|uniref:LOW QUALITY PROTEIN: mitochondrial glutathione transporter SLC25A40 n=1 Tax=Phaenicophaeus curvirostris TaxID=33595 RepID=UPI0037F0B368
MAEMSDGYLNKATIFQQAVSSCCGAIIMSLLVTPLDVIKTRLQAQSNPDAFVKSIQREGIKSLWSGLPPALIRALPTAVIYFTCCDQLSEALKSRLGKECERIPVLAGSLSRLMYWYNYDYFKRMMCKEAGVHEPTFLIAFASYCFCYIFLFLIAAVITLPFEVVKTCMQTRLWESETLKVPQRECPSTWVVMRKIVAKNGISGLFTGIIPWLCRVAPACAIMISTYEYGKSFFSHVNEKINQRP